MAKTIITQSGNLINYSNVVSVSVDSGAKKDSQNNKLFSVTAVTTNGQNTIIGSYDSCYEAHKAKDKLVEWLQSEIYGVYEFDRKEDD